jgi:hypothetical protein
VKLEQPYEQYEGKWLISLPPIQGHKLAFIYIIRFVEELHDLRRRWPTFEMVYIPEDHEGRFMRQYELGETYEEPYKPNDADLHNVVTSVFERERK